MFLDNYTILDVCCMSSDGEALVPAVSSSPGTESNSGTVSNNQGREHHSTADNNKRRWCDPSCLNSINYVKQYRTTVGRHACMYVFRYVCRYGGRSTSIFLLFGVVSSVFYLVVRLPLFVRPSSYHEVPGCCRIHRKDAQIRDLQCTFDPSTCAT